MNSYSLWHITPADIGVQFVNLTSSALEANEELYSLIHENKEIPKTYSHEDKKCIQYMQSYFLEIAKALKQNENYIGKPITLCKTFPGVWGCIAKYSIGDSILCYVTLSGIALFFDIGEKHSIDNDEYFSINAFYDRQIYEDDYCANCEESELKKTVYRFLHLLRKCVKNCDRIYSSSEEYLCYGIPYTLCITAIDIPGFDLSDENRVLKKNIFALLETSAFNNIYDKSQWELIKKKIDSDYSENFSVKIMSESLIVEDSWSGVVVAGDIEKNETCLKWLIEFELYLQSQWVWFNSYNECIPRQEYSALDLQNIINNVEFIKLQLDNDISTNMEQSRMLMRKSLIETSDISVIYSKMRGILDNKLKLKVLSDEKKKNKFSIMSDIALLVIAIMQIYGVVEELISSSLDKTDFMTLGILGIIATVCIVVLVEGKK